MSEERPREEIFIYSVICRCGETIEIKEEGMIDISCPKCSLKIKGTISKQGSQIGFGY